MSQRIKSSVEESTELLVPDDEHAVYPYFVVRGINVVVSDTINRATASPLGLHGDAVALGAAIQEAIEQYLAEASGRPFHVRLTKYCRDQGFNFHTEKKRAQRYKLPRAFKHFGVWYIGDRPKGARA